METRVEDTLGRTQVLTFCKLSSTKSVSAVQRGQSTNTVVVTPYEPHKSTKLSSISSNVQEKIISIIIHHSAATCWSYTSRLLTWTSQFCGQQIAELLRASYLSHFTALFNCLDLDHSFLGNRTNGRALQENRGGTFQFSHGSAERRRRCNPEGQSSARSSCHYN